MKDLVASSALARYPDFSLESNRFAFIATPVAGAVGLAAGLIDGRTFVGAFWWAVMAGGTSFLSWAIARELDPDRPMTAAVAMMLAPVALAAGLPGLAMGGVMLLTARLTSGTTGFSASWVDVLVLAGASGYLGLHRGGVVVVAGAAIALHIAANDRAAVHVRLRLVATVLPAITAVVAGIRGVLVPSFGRWTSAQLTVAVVGVGCAALATWRVPPVRSRDDHDLAPLLASRVRLARLLLGLVAVGVMVWLGGRGAPAVAPALAALAATLVPLPAREANMMSHTEAATAT